MKCGASLVCCSSLLLFSLFSSVRLLCVCLLCVFVFAYVCFSVIWAQLPELHDMKISKNKNKVHVVIVNKNEFVYTFMHNINTGKILLKTV